MIEKEKYSHKLMKILRVRISDKPGQFAKLASVIANYGGLLGDIVKLGITTHYVVRDVTIYVDNAKVLQDIISALDEIEGIELIDVIDEILKLHEGGKVEMRSRVRLNTLSRLRKVYTPGVAQVCRSIIENPEDVYRYTSKCNSVAIITNGTAVLGLDDIGVLAAMPVMEGKAVIFSEMVNVSAIPLLVSSKEVNEFVNTVSLIAPSFGAVNLEDISAPSCFAIERELIERLDIPVFHDDQHGTATVILAAVIKALQLTGKNKKDVKVVISGAGAAGIPTARILIEFGVSDLIMCDRIGAIYSGREEHMNPYKEEIASLSNREKRKGTLAEVIKGADLFIGVSVAGILTSDMVKSMAKEPIIFALANPVPEIRPSEALEAGAAIAVDGRTVNNALAFPGIFRGVLDAKASTINHKMMIAAANALVGQSKRDELVPDFMRRSVHIRVAEAVKIAAREFLEHH